MLRFSSYGFEIKKFLAAALATELAVVVAAGFVQVEEALLASDEPGDEAGDEAGLLSWSWEGAAGLLAWEEPGLLVGENGASGEVEPSQVAIVYGCRQYSIVTDNWSIKMKWGRSPQIVGGSIFMRVNFATILEVLQSLGLDVLQYGLGSILNFVNYGGNKEHLKMEIMREMVD